MYSVDIFLVFFCIVAIYVLLCSLYDSHLVLSATKPRHGEITTIHTNLECYTSFTINDFTSIDSCQSMLSILDKLSNNLSKYQFRKTRKYLESFYIQLPNQRQTNNVADGGDEGAAMHTMEIIKTTINRHQHSRQTNNNKLENT